MIVYSIIIIMYLFLRRIILKFHQKNLYDIVILCPQTEIGANDTDC